MSKKLLCVLLAATTLLPLTSCGSPSAKTEAATSDPAATAAETTAAETTTLYADLPDVDYGGDTTKIFVAYNVEGGDTGSGTYKGEFAVETSMGMWSTTRATAAISR